MGGELDEATAGLLLHKLKVKAKGKKILQVQFSDGLFVSTMALQLRGETLSLSLIPSPHATVLTQCLVRRRNRTSASAP